ncbi:hypothetical protein ACERZ8_13300 [Tateyamaria armeniaca]|uniref:D-galactarate dehydratase n=1 Tax=Tateyamaria armeniaca TaxID=2518930 RepID=A0ABW8UXS6_9RHOB
MFIIVLAVAGCELVPTSANDASVSGPDGAVLAPGDVQRPQARPEQSAPAPTPEVSIGTLGRTIASLGNAAEPGLWLKTPLVDATRQARVYSAKTDKSVSVTLIPIEGPSTAGSRMSLAAMQALGVSPADLVEVDVFGA